MMVFVTNNEDEVRAQATQAEGFTSLLQWPGRSVNSAPVSPYPTILASFISSMRAQLNKYPEFMKAYLEPEPFAYLRMNRNSEVIKESSQLLVLRREHCLPPMLENL